MDRRIIGLLVLCVVIAFAAPVWATSYYTDVYQFPTGTQMTSTRFNTNWLHLDSRIDSLEDGTSGPYAFKTFQVSGQSDVEADQTADTFTFVAGANITITTSASGDSITIEASTTPLVIENADATVATPTTIDFDANFSAIESPTNEVNISLIDDPTIAGYLTVTEKMVVGEQIDFTEMTAPSSPSANHGALYVADDTGTTTLYFKDSAGVATNLLSGATDESIEDLAGAMWTGNTETLITITYQDADGTIDAVVDSDLHSYSWVNVVDADITNTLTCYNVVGTGSVTNAVDLGSLEVYGTLPSANIQDSYVLNSGDTMTGTLQIDDGIGDSPYLKLQDGDNYYLLVYKSDSGYSVIQDDEGPIYLQMSGDSDDYFSFYTSGNEPYMESIGTADFNIRSTSGTVDFGDDNILTTGTITGTFVMTLDEDVTIDDGVGDSPSAIWKDGDDNTFSILKLDAGGANLINNEGAINLLASADTDDYITVTTVSGSPTIGTVGSSLLKLTASGAYVNVDKPLYLDDAIGDSPYLTFRDGDGNTASIWKDDDGHAVLQNLEGAWQIRPSNDSDDYWEFSTVANEPTLRSVGATSMNFGDASVTDLTVITDSTGDGEVVLPNDSIGTDELNWAAMNSTSLADTSDLLYEAELDSFAEAQSQIADKTLVNEEDNVAFDGNVSVGGELVACDTINCDSLVIPHKSALNLDEDGDIGIDTEVSEYGINQALAAIRSTVTLYMPGITAANMANAAAHYRVVVNESGEFDFEAPGESSSTQLSDLSDVGVTTPTNKNALMADGDSWESRAIVEADISGLDHTDVNALHPATDDLDDLADGTTRRAVTVGATFPGTPAEGDQFYFTTGQILYEYNGTLWKPIYGYCSDLQLYVNATSGSDAIGQGFGSGADACATVQYCIDNCIPGTSYGDVTVNVTAEAYAEAVTIGDKTIVGDYKITIIGTFSEELAEATVDSGTQGTGATQGQIVDAAPAWADDVYNGMWVKFEDDTATATLQGDIRPIDDTIDAGNIINICGTFDAAPAAGDTYTIQSVGTVVTSITINAGQKSIHLESLKGNFIWESTTQGEMYYCHYYHATGQTSIIYPYSEITLWDCIADNTYLSTYGCTVYLYRNRWRTTHSSYVVFASDASNVYVRYGTIIDGVDKTGCNGMGFATNSVCQPYSSAANGYNIIRNSVTGLYVFRGSGVTTSTYITFTNNTTAKTVDAATMAWDGT